jgi:DNA-binding response OmpR family regulator
MHGLEHVLMGGIPDIVVYEDDFLTRTLLEEWLGDAGYRVRIGNRCDPAADAPCDLVILSVYMPKQAGAQCTKDIHAAHDGTPVIAISGQFRPGLPAGGSTAQLLRVRQVVAKPLVRKELLESVRGILEPVRGILDRET